MMVVDLHTKERVVDFWQFVNNTVVYDERKWQSQQILLKIFLGSDMVSYGIVISERGETYENTEHKADRFSEGRNLPDRANFVSSDIS